MLSIEFFATPAGRRPAQEFLDGIPAPDRAYVVADIIAYSRDGRNAPVSWKPVKGHRPMHELRTGRFRTLFVVEAETMWILGICKKQDQDREIAAASKRMSQLLK